MGDMTTSPESPDSRAGRAPRMTFTKKSHACVRLEKDGFRDVTVEVIPSKPDSTFKDVRVKVAEADKR